jgi:large subunit ribosomal protein L1
MEEKYNISDAIKYLREDSKKREFKQSFDLVINLKNIDLKKPENKFSKDIILPHGRGKDITVCVISDSIKDAVRKDYIESVSRDKKEAKRFVKNYDFFVCEAPLMPIVGKILGRYMAPVGKMPKPFPSGGNSSSIIEDAKKSVRIKLRDTPVIHAYVGSESMEDSQIKENVEKIINETKKSIPPKAQIRNIYLKLTMSKPVKLNV